ncbi:MAG TPA: hypothetical protein VNF08_08610 [Acidimicrobiales bacterium]|nr:hypothetical protein [Acidimicrobiales bacterium]
MRKIMLVGLVGASLGLASCGAQASIDQAVTSLGASPDLQLHFTGVASGPGTAQAQSALNVLSIDMNYSNPSGAALSQSGGTANAEIVVSEGKQTLADVRVVDSNLYVQLNISAAANVPGVNLPGTEVTALQLLMGGRWFELPKSLLDSVTTTTTPTQATQAANDAAAARTIFDDLSKLIAAAPYTTLPNGGYSQTGTLQSVVNAVLPTIQSLTGSTITTKSVQGTYTLNVTTSGSAATGGSINVTAPSGVSGQGNDTVGLTVTAAHAALSIDAPPNPTIVTQSLIQGLLSQSGG